jgi:6-phosphogluconolactonase
MRDSPVTPVEVRVSDDPAAETAARLVAMADAGGHIALTGGEAPRHAYEQAAGLPADWSAATVWWGDERCVAPSDARSNFRLAHDALLARLDPPPRVERIPGERGVETATELYEQALATVFGERPPAFELLLLGLGPDGHCASLFPGAPELAVTDRRVVGVEHAALEPLVPRVSLTLPALTAARDTLFLATGAEKAEGVRRAFGSPAHDVPARRVAEAAARVTVLLDDAAASKL